MKIAGKCYCGNVHYEAEGEPLMRVQCHCRECQYISGGNANLVMGMPKSGFHYTRGEVKQFQRDDIENAVVREFCPNCGTHITSCPPSMDSLVLIKVGTLDDPGVFEKPDMAIFTVDKQCFHLIAEGVPSFERVPG